MDALEQRRLYRHGAEAFFDGASFLVGVSSPTLIFGLRLAASLARLLLTRDDARLDRVLNAPVDVVGQGYDRPDRREVIVAFSPPGRWPGVAEVFAAEVARDQWRPLQRFHRQLTELLEWDRPVLRAAFAEEIAAQDWRAVVDQWEAVTRGLARLQRDAATRSALTRFAHLLTDDGPVADDAAARARIAAHWVELKDATLAAFR